MILGRVEASPSSNTMMPSKRNSKNLCAAVSTSSIDTDIKYPVFFKKLLISETRVETATLSTDGQMSPIVWLLFETKERAELLGI